MRVKIKEGTMVVQDYYCNQWPILRNHIADTDLIFETRWDENIGCWECVAPGYGAEPYGNGSIFVYDKDAVNEVRDAN